MSDLELRKSYEQRYTNVLVPLAEKLETLIDELVMDYPRIDRVIARAKEVGSFIDKANNKEEDGSNKYSDPINQIQDQIGARIITHYLFDVIPIRKIIKDYFGPKEEKYHVPDSAKEFDYEGFHYILFIPRDLLTPDLPKEHCPRFFELQIKTLFQHAWAESSHNLIYKPPKPLTYLQEKKGAFASAQAWGADRIFDDLTKELILNVPPVTN